MKSFFKFLSRYNFFLLFLIFETIAFTMILKSDKTKNNLLLRRVNVVTGYIYDNINKISHYAQVDVSNQRLLLENARLHNRSRSSYLESIKDFKVKHDSIMVEDDTLTIVQQYHYTTAKVINNTTNRKYNFLTLNKGKVHGIEEDMGVVSSEGIVGVVTHVSEHFSTVVSLLNIQLGISSKLKKNNHPGMIQWDGTNPEKISLNEIPVQIPLDLGDTVITSGYSAIFPEGIIVGTISNFKQQAETNTYKIDIKLGADYLTLNYVYIIGNLLREERLQIEKAVTDD